MGPGGEEDGCHPPEPGATTVRRVRLFLFFVYSHQLELAVSLPLGSAVPFLKIAPGESLLLSADDRWLLQSTIEGRGCLEMHSIGY